MVRPSMTPEEATLLAKSMLDLGASRFSFDGTSVEVEFKHSTALMEARHEVELQRTRDEIESDAEQTLMWSAGS